MIKSKLSDIGLSENEIDVYLASLELGESKVSEIAKKAGVKRPTTYLVIETLKEKGLISALKKKKKTFFYAEDPRKLKERADEKKRLIDDAIPELLAIANFIDKKPKIAFYEGVEGIKDVYRDTLNYPSQPMLAWVSEEAFNVLDEDFIKYYIPERAGKKIWVKVLAPDTPETRKYKEDDIKHFKETRLINNDNFLIKVEINLYGKNKIGIMSFKEKIGLIIESEKIFITLKSIFETIWNGVK